MLDTADTGGNLILSGLDTVRENMMTLYNRGSHKHQSDTNEGKSSLHTVQKGCLQVTSADFRGCDAKDTSVSGTPLSVLFEHANASSK